MKPKVLVFDMDGTLVNSQGLILDQTKHALKIAYESGLKLFIATGRPYVDTIRDTKDIAHFFNFFICNNGTYAVNPNTLETFSNEGIPLSILSKVIDIAKNSKSFLIVHGKDDSRRVPFFSTKNLNWNSPDFFEFSKFQNDLNSLSVLLSWVPKQEIMQISLRASSEEIQKLMDKLMFLKKEFQIHLPNEYYIDINLKNIHKFDAVQTIINKLKILPSEVMSFGDSNNDLELLSESGWGICMGNGTIEAKEAANEIIGDFNEPVIAERILKLFEKN